MTDWKRKLAAYLHDPPHKPRTIAAHEDQRGSFLNRLGLDPDALQEFDRSNDWQAASADRLVFPNAAKSGLWVDWKANDHEFRHPLGGGRLTPSEFPVTAAGMEEAFVSALDGIAPDSEDWKLKFIRSWRLWPERSAREKKAHLAYVVADTRIPDHTLWQHNALTAAFTATAGKPAFLLFQIGPVKDFIAQARKTQDLWSGSYLLSFLIAKAMLAVADEIGPDSLVYPQLRGAPLADWHWRKILGGDDENPPLRASHSNELLTPNLPNRFLALIPAGEAGQELARIAEKSVRNSWAVIAKSVRDVIGEQADGECPGWDSAWDAQVARFPVVDWVVHDWSDTKTALEQAAQKTPPLSGGWHDHALRHAFLWSTQMIPSTERENYGPTSSSGFAWALHYALTEWKLAARKNARSFASWTKPGEPLADGVPKDHLDGRNEALGGSRHKEFREILNQKFPSDFKGSQLYGAVSVIKRLWPSSYLGGKRENGGLGWTDWKPKFDSVQDIAKAIDREESETLQGREPKYYAVLCMDGDDMGQWVSGVKAAQLVKSLAKDAAQYFTKHWNPESKLPAGAELPVACEVKRPLSPGYHASLSEALANFSLYCAGPITVAFGGQLLYAGGDDLVAMVPASAALDCAQALQLAFRGINPDSADAHASKQVTRVLKDIFDYTHHVQGFISLRRSQRGDVGRAEHLKPNWPLMVMGPLATSSVGIAIGHVRSPMQDTIQAARDAEHRAKKVSGKGAFCLRILKRSGEAVSFAAKWDSGVPAVWSELNQGVHNLSSRFAHRFADLVAPLVMEGGSTDGTRYAKSWNTDAKLAEIIELELTHVLKKQGGKAPLEARELAKFWRDLLIGEDHGSPALSPGDFLHFWTAWAFVRRQSEPDTDSER